VTPQEANFIRLNLLHFSTTSKVANITDLVQGKMQKVLDVILMTVIFAYFTLLYKYDK